MQPGDVRLIAWTDEPLPGMKVRPVAPQKRQLALLVANPEIRVRRSAETDDSSRYDFVKRANVFRDDPNAQKEEESAPQPLEPANDTRPNVETDNPQ